MSHTPLQEAQRALGAIFAEVDGALVASVFSDAREEYRAATERVALVDRSRHGRLVARGADTLDLLNRLSTNKLDDLPVGRGAGTVLTTAKGRIVDWLTVLHPDQAVVLLTSPGRQEAVAEWIDLYTFDEDTTLEDVSDATALLGVVGPAAGRAVEQALGVRAHLDLYDCLAVDWRSSTLTVARTDPTGGPGYDVIVPESAAAELWRALMEAGAPEGITPLGEEAFEALRVTSGVPRWGRELGEQRNPLEAGLEGSISWTKGCYTGQEVVARLQTYHKVQRYLVGLALGADGLSVRPGAALVADGKTVGTVTSVAVSPPAAEAAALGYVRTAYVQEGGEVAVEVEGGSARARIVRIPELPRDPVPAALLDVLDEDEDEGAS